MGVDVTREDGVDEPRGSLDDLFSLGVTFCHVHQIDEPTTGVTHKVCFECGHAFQTKADLVTAYNGKVNEAHQFSKSSKPPAYINYNTEVPCCPVCDHDF